MADLIVRKDCAPDGMRMQNSPGSSANDCEMQQRLGRRPAWSGPQRFAFGIDFENLFRRKAAFVERTGGDRKSERFAIDDGAKISARSQSPAAPMKIVCQ